MNYKTYIKLQKNILTYAENIQGINCYVLKIFRLVSKLKILDNKKNKYTIDRLEKKSIVKQIKFYGSLYKKSIKNNTFEF